jgi:hypothetical protein
MRLYGSFRPECHMTWPITWCLIQIAVPCSSCCSFLAQILFLLCNVTHPHRGCCHVRKPSLRNYIGCTRYYICSYHPWCLVHVRTDYLFHVLSSIILHFTSSRNKILHFMLQTFKTANDSLKIPSKRGDPLTLAKHFHTQRNGILICVP